MSTRKFSKEFMVHRITEWLMSEGLSTEKAEQVAPRVLKMIDAVSFDLTGDVFVHRYNGKICIRAVTSDHPDKDKQE